jgi:hypothetical protein
MLIHSLAIKEKFGQKSTQIVLLDRLEKIKREVTKTETWKNFVKSIKNSNSKNKKVHVFKKSEKFINSVLPNNSNNLKVELFKKGGRKK